MVGLIRALHQRPRPSPDAPMKPLPWWWILIAVVTVIASVWITTESLLAVVADATGAPPTEVAKLRVDAIRTGLTVGAGTGGAVALALAMRRQWLNERMHAHEQRVATATMHDANERRITELYTKAVDSLGHEKAAVRLGALYALERLAQAETRQRQTIVDVICAYLRMPYADKENIHEDNDYAGSDATSGDDSDAGEKQVRVAAQRILTNHARFDEDEGGVDPPSTYWPDVNIDLRGATLFNFDFRACRIAHGQFGDTVFVGTARFGKASFRDRSSFRRSEFRGHAWFEDARFLAGIRFEDAIFNATSQFTGARFEAIALFDRVRFNGSCGFTRARFAAAVSFADTLFGSDAAFRNTDFMDGVSFRRSCFSARARFGDSRYAKSCNFDFASFSGDTGFGNSRFDGRAKFIEASFERAVRFGGSEFRSAVRLDRAKFHETVSFANAIFFSVLRLTATEFRGPVQMTGARFHRKMIQNLPAGWCLSTPEDDDSPFVLVRCEDAGGSPGYQVSADELEEPPADPPV